MIKTLFKLTKQLFKKKLIKLLFNKTFLLTYPKVKNNMIQPKNNLYFIIYSVIQLQSP